MTVDYAIVGAGPAACVLAFRLTADPSVRVLLLEAGPTNPTLFRRALARATNRSAAARLWPYQTVPQAALGGRRVYLPQGRALGGGSAVNAMTYLRGRPDDYLRWEQAGNTGWGPNAVLDAFKRLEHNHRIADAYHGTAGPLHVSDLVNPHPLSRAFVAAAREVGLPENDDFNGETQLGLGLYQVTQRDGRRCGAADAFLGAAADRRNLTVLTGATATRVLMQGRRAVGVEFRHAGRLQQVRAERGTIVSGGAINSPKVLLLSGIGPADDLRALGIPVVVDLPGVGRNLHDHLNVQIVAQCRGVRTYDRWDQPSQLLRAGLQYLLFNTGIATSNLCESGGFLMSSPDRPDPDLQIHCLPLIWRDHGRAPVATDESGMTLEVAFLHPESRGTVTLASADPDVPPAIDPQYCTKPPDLARLVEGIRRGREILAAPSLARWVVSESQPGPVVQSDAQLERYVRDTAITAYHPVGSCRMGTDSLAVVDPDLRVRGVEALHVIDVSVMPSIVSASTQAPAMMIGEMGAARLLGTAV